MGNQAIEVDTFPYQEHSWAFMASHKIIIVDCTSANTAITCRIVIEPSYSKIEGVEWEASYA